MKEIYNIYNLSIKSIKPKNEVRVVCEKCNSLADFFVIKGDQEKYLCRIHLHSWIKTDNVHYQIHQEE